MSKVRGAVGTEKRPPLIVVMGLGKGTEGPREETGALWSLVTLVAIKLCFTITASNIAILLSGPQKDGAIYCTKSEGCSTVWLHYQFYCDRFMALTLTFFVFCLEIGVGPVVKLSGEHRGSWYNNYFVRGIVWFYIGVLTTPDRLWIWYADIVEGMAAFAMYYGIVLICIVPGNFVLSLIPRGYPTSIKTQRPESTFWATVTLLACSLCTLGFAANCYEIFGEHKGENLAFATYSETVESGTGTKEGKRLYVYQQYMQRLAVAFFLPLLFASELEVTAVLHSLPELRYLVTKGPLYLLIGAVLLIADDEWPAHNFVNYTSFAFLIMGCMYLAFPAVRIIHELFGDRLSPKTRFYPGLYTFFSVWGVVLSILTVVLLMWQAIVYDVHQYDWVELYLWYSFKVMGIMISLLAACVELELQWIFDMEIGGVPVHFDFLRNWIARSLLYLLIACMCAESGAAEGYVSLFDLDRAVMWTWVGLSVTYAVFFLHLVSSAILYRLYIANGAWFSKREDHDDAVVASETQSLLGDRQAGGGGGGGAEDIEAGWAAGARAGAAKLRKSGNDAKSGGTKKEAMKKFVLQPKARLLIAPIKFTEHEQEEDEQEEESPALAAAAAPAGDADDAKKKNKKKKKPAVASHFFVRCLLGEDGEGSSSRVEPKSAAAQAASSSSGSRRGAPPAQQRADEGNGPRTAKWPPTESIPLLVSPEVAKMGKAAAIEVQVWAEGPKKTGGWGEKGGSTVSDLQVGEARVALDQLTLGVPGMVQLHAPHNPNLLRGTLELVISYEPAPDEGSSSGGGSGGGRKGGKTPGGYETAVDPNSGRKYWFNRSTGHRTWTQPAEAGALEAAGASRLAPEEQILTNATI